MRTFAAGLLIAGLIAVGCGQPPAGSSTDVALTSSSSAADGSKPATGLTSSTSDSADRAATATSGTLPAAWHDVTIPAGTTLALSLDTAVASDTSRVEEPVHAHLTRAVAIDGVTVIPEESAVSGVVTSATRAGKVDGRAHLAIRFDTLALPGQDERYQLETNAYGRTAPSEKKKDAAKIGVPAAGGAIIGGIVGGKKGAVIGGAVGGGAGTAVVLSDRGQEVRLGKGAAISLKLTEPLTIRVRD